MKFDLSVSPSVDCCFGVIFKNPLVFNPRIQKTSVLYFLLEFLQFKIFHRDL